MQNETDTAINLLQRETMTLHENVLYMKVNDEWTSDKNKIHYHLLRKNGDLGDWLKTVLKFKRVYYMLSVLLSESESKIKICDKE